AAQPPEMYEYPVLRHAAQPAAKGIGRLAVAKRFQGDVGLGEHLLDDVVNVLAGHAAPPAPVAHQRIVQEDESLPRIRLIVARPRQQAARRAAAMWRRRRFGEHYKCL